jgi:hypothetical protein
MIQKCLKCPTPKKEFTHNLRSQIPVAAVKTPAFVRVFGVFHG